MSTQPHLPPDLPGSAALLSATGAWIPNGVDAAIATLDRISRHCEFSCTLDADRCAEVQCRAWVLEGAAATYLAGRWADVQD